MKKILITLITALAIGGCGLIKTVPVETKYETITNYVDSLRIKDSIRVIPIERYVDIVRPVDTLTLETSLAKATAYYDSTFNVLRGEIYNKKQVEEHHHFEEHSTAKADTVKIEKEIPIPIDRIEYKTPTWSWYSLIFNIVGLLLIGFGIYLKIKKKTLKI